MSIKVKSKATISAGIIIVHKRRKEADMSLNIKLELKDTINLEELLYNLQQEFNIDNIDITSERWILRDALENYIDNIETEYYCLWRANENIILETLAKFCGLEQKED